VQSRVDLFVHLLIAREVTVILGDCLVSGGEDASLGSMLWESALSCANRARSLALISVLLAIQSESVSPAHTSAWHIRANCIHSVVLIANLGRQDGAGIIIVVKDFGNAAKLRLPVLHCLPSVFHD